MFLKEVYSHFMTPLGNPGNESFLLPSMGKKKLGVFFVVSFLFFFASGCSDLTFDMNTKSWMPLLTSSKSGKRNGGTQQFSVKSFIVA